MNFQIEATVNILNNVRNIVSNTRQIYTRSLNQAKTQQDVSYYATDESMR